MKTNNSTWVLIVLVVFCCLLASCVQPPQPVELDKLTIPQLEQNQMAVIIKIDDNNYKNIVVSVVDNNTAEDVLTYLQQENVLEMEFIDDQYGKYLTKLDVLQQDATAGKYLSVYTSDKDNHSVWAGATTYTVGDVTLAPASVGITELPVGSGTVLLFELITY